MRDKDRRHGVVFVAAGLAGVAALTVLGASGGPALPDFVRGLGIGACLGLELLGGFLLYRHRSQCRRT